MEINRAVGVHGCHSLARGDLGDLGPGLAQVAGKESHVGLDLGAGAPVALGADAQELAIGRGVAQGQGGSHLRLVGGVARVDVQVGGSVVVADGGEHGAVGDGQRLEGHDFLDAPGCEFPDRLGGRNIVGSENSVSGSHPHALGVEGIELHRTRPVHGLAMDPGGAVGVGVEVGAALLREGVQEPPSGAAVLALEELVAPTVGGIGEAPLPAVVAKRACHEVVGVQRIGRDAAQGTAAGLGTVAEIAIGVLGGDVGPGTVDHGHPPHGASRHAVGAGATRVGNQEAPSRHHGAQRHERGRATRDGSEGRATVGGAVEVVGGASDAHVEGFGGPAHGATGAVEDHEADAVVVDQTAAGLGTQGVRLGPRLAAVGALEKAIQAATAPDVLAVARVHRELLSRLAPHAVAVGFEERGDLGGIEGRAVVGRTQNPGATVGEVFGATQDVELAGILRIHGDGLGSHHAQNAFAHPVHEGDPAARRNVPPIGAAHVGAGVG